MGVRGQLYFIPSADWLGGGGGYTHKALHCLDNWARGTVRKDIHYLPHQFITSSNKSSDISRLYSFSSSWGRGGEGGVFALRVLSYDWKDILLPSPWFGIMWESLDTVKLWIHTVFFPAVWHTVYSTNSRSLTRINTRSHSLKNHHKAEHIQDGEWKNTCIIKFDSAFSMYSLSLIPHMSWIMNMLKNKTKTF